MREELLERHGKRNGVAVALDAAEIKMRPGEFTSLVLVVFVVVWLVGMARQPGPSCRSCRRRLR